MAGKEISVAVLAAKAVFGGLERAGLIVRVTLHLWLELCTLYAGRR